MKVRHVGFFSDLPHGIPAEPRLLDVIAELPIEDEKRLVEYLANGVLFIASPGIVHDVLSEQNVIIGSADIVTDGVWAWPRDLSYYVERYHVRLPDDFIKHVLVNRWVVPGGIDVNLLEFEI